KSILAEFFANTGIEPLSIASCNHLDNDNEQNLSGKRQFRSKEISNSSVVDDMVAANRLLQASRAHQEGTRATISLPSSTFPSPLAIPSAPSIFYGGHSVINIFNECEGFSADSLLATPLVLDLPILAELLTRVNYHKVGEAEFKPYHLVLSLIFYHSFVVGTEVINSFNRQRNTLEIFFKACLGLEGSSKLLPQTRLG
ncbi:hypothetical protein FA15DRAFT_606508, partial [Coprinopsis marcescibilis]